MTGMWAAFQILKSLAESVIESRLGQLALIATVAWFWSAHNTNEKWRAYVASEKAAAELAYQKELVRQQKAAEEIAKAATKRAEDDARAVSDMQAVIEEYEKKLKEKPHVTTKVVKSDACVIDDNFSNVLRQLSNAASRSPKTPRRTK